LVQTLPRTEQPEEQLKDVLSPALWEKSVNKVLFLLKIVIVFVMLPLSVLAEEKTGDRITTMLILRNDLIAPQSGKKLSVQSVVAYWHYKWIGGGAEVYHVPGKKNYDEIKPILTVNKGPLYGLVGYRGNSLSEKYIQVGGWYVNRFRKLTVFLDVRNFCAVSKTSVSYLETWVSFYYPLGDRFYIGAENRFIHWWDPKNHNLATAGPELGVNITKTMSVYFRPFVSWDMMDAKTNRDLGLQFGLKLQF
jgi:hypothetical protein